jgi:hypothetical protein
MLAGAIGRSVAQAVVHPFHTRKTILQLKDSIHGKDNTGILHLYKGLDAQILLSLPHGALYFGIMDQVDFLLSFFCS